MPSDPSQATPDIEWHVQPLSLEKFGDPLPDQTLDLIRKYRVAIKGPLTTPIGKGMRSVNVALRRELDLLRGVVETLDALFDLLELFRAIVER